MLLALGGRRKRGIEIGLYILGYIGVLIEGCIYGMNAFRIKTGQLAPCDKNTSFCNWLNGCCSMGC